MNWVQFVAELTASSGIGVVDPSSTPMLRLGGQYERTRGIYRGI